MRSAPRWVVRRLQTEFGGRLRLRWSNRRQAWFIEQRLAPGQILTPPRRTDGPWDTENDRYIQARDGYGEVLRITAGDRMQCERCFLPVKVPVLEFGEARCEHCIARGVDARYRASYWPIDSEAILQHLRRLDPERGRVLDYIKDLDAANHARSQAIDRTADNALHDGLYDAAIDQLPIFGYAQQSSAWVR